MQLILGVTDKTDFMVNDDTENADLLNKFFASVFVNESTGE